MAPTLGEPAPLFALPDERGREVVAPVGGRPTVLVFYRGDW